MKTYIENKTDLTMDYINNEIEAADAFGRPNDARAYRAMAAVFQELNRLHPYAITARREYFADTIQFWFDHTGKLEGDMSTDMMGRIFREVASYYNYEADNYRDESHQTIIDRYDGSYLLTTGMNRIK